MTATEKLGVWVGQQADGGVYYSDRRLDETMPTKVVETASCVGEVLVRRLTDQEFEHREHFETLNIGFGD